MICTVQDRVSEHIERIVATAPPLSSEQAERIAPLVRGSR